jgi:hypothetical protein
MALNGSQTDSLMIANNSTTWAWVAINVPAIVPASGNASTGFPIAPNAIVIIGLQQATVPIPLVINAVAATGTGTVYVTPGYGT